MVVPGLMAGDGATGFEVHAIQHLLFGMLAPVFFALSAPVTLLLACIGSIRVRRTIAKLLRSRPLKVVAHPMVAATFYAGSMVLIYASPLYGWTLESDLLHGVVHLHMFLVGCLYCWALIAVDPVLRPPGLAIPVAALLIGAATHAVLSKALYAGGLEAAAVIPADQREAGAMLMFYGGDLVELILVTVFFVQLFAKRARRRRWRDRIEGRELGKGLSCSSASNYFRQFLLRPDGVLPRPWRLNPKQAVFRAGKNRAFRVQQA